MAHSAHGPLVQGTRIAGAAFMVYTVVMVRYEAIMYRTGGGGIIGFELAGNADRADTIIDAWGPVGVSAARTSLRLDFGYMASYGVFLTFLTETARRRHGPNLPTAVGHLMHLAPVVAVACDAREGTELLAVLRGQDVDRRARRARSAARAKFAALFVGLTFWSTSRHTRA